jgi:bacillithiol biosynthesis deacetylase BshB1
MTVDVLAIGAHPDDVELGVGGILLKVAAQGRSFAILDLTRGEQSSRGTPEERLVESAKAAAILGAATRQNAGLPDGGLENTREQRRAIIPYIRQFRPTIILAHMGTDRHPDHCVAHALTRDANFYSGLASIVSDTAAHRAPRMYYFHPYYQDPAPPPIVIDVSDVFERKLEALRAHQSQFFNPDYDGAPTYVSSAEFWDAIHDRAAYWGHRIGAAFGEPLYTDGPLGLTALPGLGAAP